MPEPHAVTVRMYNVGFGDCFLLTFHYRGTTRTARHMLIDCGSTKQAQSTPLKSVVDDIRERVDYLDVLVVTHRHADHLSAFGAAATASTLESLEPRAVIRPWVDDPDIEPAADEPTTRFLSSLRLAQRFANDLELAIKEVRESDAGRTPALLAAAEAQVANLDAIHRIDKLAANAAAAHYLNADAQPLRLRQLPGVELHVLGPPTFKQLPEARTAAKNYKDQYWLSQLGLLQDALAIAGLTSKRAKYVARAALDAQATDSVIGPARWLIEKMQDRHEQALSRIVEGIDKALNNTSLVLLIQAGMKKMLFPGDAQGENWSWALEHAPKPVRSRWETLLTDVDLYKVGHHGSRNATPKSLYAFWENRNRELVSLMSTLPGKHGKAASKTEVPRKTLITGLNDIGTLLRTDQPKKQTSLAVQASTTNRRAFARLPE